MAKMAKLDTLFMTKTAEYPTLEGAHIHIDHTREYFPGPVRSYYSHAVACVQLSTILPWFHVKG